MSCCGLDLLGAETVSVPPVASKAVYEALKQLPAATLRARAQKALDRLVAYKTSAETDMTDNASSYRLVLEQTEWQIGNGDKATTDAEKRLFYARAVHMAEDALVRFDVIGPGDSYWTTAKETGGKIVDAGGKVIDFALTLPRKVIETTTGAPTWVWVVGGVTGVGLLGYGAYRILMVAAPSLVGVAARRYT